LVSAFGALVAKQFKDFDEKAGTLNLEFTLIIRLIVDDLDEELTEKLKNNLKYRLNEDEKEAPKAK